MPNDLRTADSVPASTDASNIKIEDLLSDQKQVDALSIKEYLAALSGKERLTAKEIVALGYYQSIWCVYRAVESGQIPEGTWNGKRQTWPHDALRTSVEVRAGQPRPRPSPRKVVVRSNKP